MRELSSNLSRSPGKRLSYHKWIICLLSFLTVFSLVSVGLFWLTDSFSKAIIWNLQLRNGSLSFALWQRPAVRAVYRIRVFNYTNVKDFEAGLARKLRVQEVGPYIYRETLSRVNLEIEKNDTVTYQEMRSYQWEGGSPDDEIITVPNIPLFTAMAFSRDMNFLAQVSLTAILSTIRAKPFIQVPVSDFLWGYDDELFRIAKPLMFWQQSLPYDKFGLLAFVSIRIHHSFQHRFANRTRASAFLACTHVAVAYFSCPMHEASFLIHHSDKFIPMEFYKIID